MLNESKYEKQAREFAEKHSLTVTAVYNGHYPRFRNNITANYTITLSRPGKRPYICTFSTSINDSWYYTKDGRAFKKFAGLPPGIDTEKFMVMYASRPIPSYKNYGIYQTRKTPTMYDILACLTKRNPGTFENFCAEYDYSEDSRAAEKTWYAVKEEGRAVETLFSDCLEELEEIQ